MSNELIKPSESTKLCRKREEKVFEIVILNGMIMRPLILINKKETPASIEINGH